MSRPVAISTIDRAPPAARPEKGVTFSEKAYRLLRHKILRSEIAAGEKLKIEVLQREHELSSSPLREALNRLAAEGLVVSDDHRGFRAAIMSPQDLRDITGFRLVIEPAALGESIANGNDEWEAGIVAAFHRLERVEGRLTFEQLALSQDWTERHKEFHMALVSACSSARMLASCSSLFDQAERYRRFSVMHRKVPRKNGEEHRRLMETSINRDAAAATSLLRDHIARTAEHVLSIQNAGVWSG